MFLILIENKTSKKTITKNVKNTYFIHVVIYFFNTIHPFLYIDNMSISSSTASKQHS